MEEKLFYLLCQYLSSTSTTLTTSRELPLICHSITESHKFCHKLLLICVFLEVITECARKSPSLSGGLPSTDVEPGRTRYLGGGGPAHRPVYTTPTPPPHTPPRLLSNLSSAHRSSSLSTVSSLDIGLFALKLLRQFGFWQNEPLAEVTQSGNI